MRLLLLTLALLPAAAPARDVLSPQERTALRCRSGVERVGYNRLPRPTHRLAQEPPAALLAAVHRKVDGCPTPVVLREGIGADGDGERPEIRADAHLEPLR